MQKYKPYGSDFDKLAAIKIIVKQSYKQLSKDILMIYRVLNG